MRDISTVGVSFTFMAFRTVAGSVAAGGSSWHENLPVACRTRWGIREAGETVGMDSTQAVFQRQLEKVRSEENKADS